MRQGRVRVCAEGAHPLAGGGDSWLVMGSVSRGHPFIISSITAGYYVLVCSAPTMLCAWCFTCIIGGELLCKDRSPACTGAI